MLNLCKYSFFTELEKKYQGYFKLAKNVYLLPPILKKVGIINYLAFLVVENNEEKNIKRPIGIILINRITGQEKIYDMSEYDFCPTLSDFDYIYYNLNLENIFFPNKSLEMQEYFKVSLDYLARSTSSKFFNIDNNIYQKYLERIKKIFPKNYFIFFEELQKNQISPINNDNKIKRKISNIDDPLIDNKSIKQRIIKNTILKKQFKIQIRNLITNYIKDDILPELKNNGSFGKICFYYEFGKYYKQFEKNITNNYNCYGEEIDEKIKNINIEILLKREKLAIRKILIEYKDNPKNKIDLVDALSKVLIVFLNALLVEEIHNSIIKNFEDEIKECIDIFKENENKSYDVEAKQYLYNIFNELLNDYKTVNNENLSNTYFAYLVIHFPFNL